MIIRAVNKTTIIFSFLIFLYSALNGQETQGFSIPVKEFQKEGVLIFKQIYGSVDISGQDRDDILVTAQLLRRDSNSKPSEIPTVNFTKNSYQVEIENFLPDWKVNWKIIVPAHFNLRINNVDEGDITISGMDGQIEVSHVNGSIFLSQLLKSASANTTNGTIEADFSQVEEDCAIAFSTFEGPINVSFPSELSAKIILATEKGKIFSDFIPSDRLSKNNENFKSLEATKDLSIEVKVGEGKGEVLLTSFNGNLTVNRKNKLKKN